MSLNPSSSPPLPDAILESIADALWGRMVGANLDPIELNLRAKLALEQRLLGGVCSLRLCVIA